MSVIVFGSINLDLVAQTARLPSAGETLQGYQFFIAPGGKGANQAVAAARLGITTYMVGRVGGDRFGDDLLSSLNTAQVQTKGVFTDPDTHSGIAMIAVDQQGENSIIVIPGANGQVDQTDIERLMPLLSGASALLLQLELPLAAIEAAASAAQKLGVKVILDPAPAPQTLPETLYRSLNIITPNETEASRLVGFELSDAETITQAAQVFLHRGVETVVLKLGARGAFCATAVNSFWIKAFPVTVVDTVAAGDAFNGGMAAGLERGLSLRESLGGGAAAGALAVTKPGAQPSLPDWQTFEDFLKQQS